jgi:hypothetical protein
MKCHFTIHLISRITSCEALHNPQEEQLADKGEKIIPILVLGAEE